MDKLFFLLLGIYIQYLIIAGKLSFYVNNKYEQFIWLMSFIICLVYLFLLRDVRFNNILFRFSKTDFIYIFLIIIFFFVQATPLGTSLANNRNLNIVKENIDIISEYNKSLIINSKKLTLEEWVNITNLSSDLKKFEGMPVEIEGMLFERKDQHIIGKYTVACCAVDASVIGLNILVNEKFLMEVGIWYKIEGEIYLNEDKDFFIKVINSSKINQPKNPYIN